MKIGFLKTGRQPKNEIIMMQRNIVLQINTNSEAEREAVTGYLYEIGRDVPAAQLQEFCALLCSGKGGRGAAEMIPKLLAKKDLLKLL